MVGQKGYQKDGKLYSGQVTKKVQAQSYNRGLAERRFEIGKQHDNTSLGGTAWPEVPPPPQTEKMTMRQGRAGWTGQEGKTGRRGTGRTRRRALQDEDVSQS